MKPILKYPGAKWRLAPWIVERLPAHEGYCEPFFGSGAVFFNKPKSRIETINDIDGNIVRFFEVCRQWPNELAEALRLTPYARKEYESCRAFDVGDVEFARRFAVLCCMAFGAGGADDKTGWRNTTASCKNGGPDNPKLWRRMPELVVQAAERLRDAQIECRPAITVIEEYDGPEMLFYCDPPYLLETRSKHGPQYTHEMTEADHERLLDVLLAAHGMVLLSGYDNDLYRDKLRYWSCEKVATTGERAVRRVECLWINPAARERIARQMNIEEMLTMSERARE